VLAASCLSADLPTRHGAACALAAAVRALHGCGQLLPPDTQQMVVQVNTPMASSCSCLGSDREVAAFQTAGDRHINDPGRAAASLTAERE
jgi:hypothetical protein